MDTKDQAQTSLTHEQKLKEIESIMRKNVKSKSLTDEAYAYMALLVVEDMPKNPKELLALIGDFLSDGMTYDEDESWKLTQQIS